MPRGSGDHECETKNGVTIHGTHCFCPGRACECCDNTANYYQAMVVMAEYAWIIFLVFAYCFLTFVVGVE